MLDKERGTVGVTVMPTEPSGGEVPVAGVAEAEFEVLDELEEVGAGGVERVFGGGVLEVLSDVTTYVRGSAWALVAASGVRAVGG